MYKKYGVHFHLNSHEHMYERPSLMSNDFSIKHYNSEGKRINEAPNQKRLVQQNNMKASYKGEIPYKHQFDGDLVQITNGCAGTTEYFLDHVADFPINSVIVTGTQCHSIIEISDNTFRVKVLKSEDPSVILDDFTMYLTPETTSNLTRFIVILLILVTFFSVGLVMSGVTLAVRKSKKGGEYMMAEIRRNQRIESG